jgi:hypothetical protein
MLRIDPTLGRLPMADYALVSDSTLRFAADAMRVEYNCCMPATQTVDHDGYKASVRPAFRLRRLFRFPLYFQAFQPRFEITVGRCGPTPENGEPLKQLLFYIHFADGTRVEYPVDVTNLKPCGQPVKRVTDPILLSPNGDARICLQITPPVVTQERFHTPYAFVVTPDSTFVFLLLNIALGALVAILLAIFRGS